MHLLAFTNETQFSKCFWIYNTTDLPFCERVKWCETAICFRHNLHLVNVLIHVISGAHHSTFMLHRHYCNVNDEKFKKHSIVFCEMVIKQFIR